jgi:hypothetical protein
MVKAENAHPEAIEIQFVGHKYIPQIVRVQAGAPFTIRVTNSSRDRIEFESFKLNRERVIEPGQTVVLRLPALRPGSYDFYDDFHQDVPEGEIIAGDIPNSAPR